MGMQGWRKSMEDAHIAQLDLTDGVAVFGVFDGHGGKSIKTECFPEHIMWHF